MDVSKIIDLAQSNQVLFRCLEDIYLIITNDQVAIPESNIPIFNDILKELNILKQKAIEGTIK